MDSSVAALLAAGDGVIAGVTLRLSDQDEASAGEGRCCAARDIRDARRVAATLDLPHYVVDMRDRFDAEVVQPFVQAYLQGRTPIPCVACNDRLKFDDLLVRASALGAERVVTGHHARRVERGGFVRLVRARDRAKDQSYFLHGLTQAQLRAASFPVGEITKDEVRAIAREHGLGTADKPESMEICFVPEGDVASFVAARAGDSGTVPGRIVDRAGRDLGAHAGVHAFTVGQRRGLGAHGTPMHVLELKAEDALVVIGPREALACSEARVERFHWIAGAPGGAIEADVQVRHGRHAVRARIVPDGVGARVVFAEPHGPVSPGQSAVAYQDDEVLGGGPITSTTRAA